MQDIFAELSWRGLIHQTTDPAVLSKWLNEKPRVLYAGFDPTADSLHVGHMMGVLALRRFQKAGHRPIALVGGATGMIGDPSGKSEERNLLSLEALRHNVASLKSQLSRFIDFDDSSNGALLVNNYDWFSKFSFLDFLRDIGKHFPVNVMLAKDSVQSRIEGNAGISYTEFSYMLLQAYDFVHLHREYGCELQIGGSDQWGNITAGMDLARRMHQASLHGLTWPLLTKSDGTKMGKTEKGALWLSADKTSPYQFYQYWVGIDDNDAAKGLRYLAELPKEEVEALDQQRLAEPHLRASQKRLAEELTRLVHGEAGLAAAKNASQKLFEGDLAGMTDASLGDVFADVPSVEVPRERLEAGKFTLVDALVETQLAKSKSEARRTIEQSGAYVNNKVRTGVETILSSADLASETIMVVRSGKKKYALVRFRS